MKVDAFHLHEVLDRAHIIASMVDDLLADHIAVQAHPDTLGAAVLKLEEAAAEMYQVAGSVAHKVADQT
jgi:hypothetical protein